MLRPLALALLALTAAACARRPAQPYNPFRAFHDDPNRVAAGSGFVFEYGPCYLYRFDAVRSTLTRDEGADHSGTASRGRRRRLVHTVRLTLTPDETRQIYEEMERIGIWAYPPMLTNEMQLDSTSSWAPEYGLGVRYRLDVRRGERATVVRWATNLALPLTAEARRLRALGDLIREIVEAKHAYLSLPPLMGRCA